MSELWATWEGEVVNGELPLRRLVGVSDHSGVFLTEAPAYNLPSAAIKLVPALPTMAESQLAYWNAAARLSHPRLLRLFAAGRCQLSGGATSQGNLQFLYVLMEYADQNLAQLLESRALTEIEARETVPPVLEALAFLHSRNLVQGQLKPSNILVVGEQLKLASDTIRPAGEAATSISMQSVYDPPEGRDGSFSTAGDVWALGVTLYEALTRTTPARPDERSHGVVLPPDFPPASADVIRECLSRRPGDRPSVAALQAWVSGKIRYPGARSSRGAAAGDDDAASPRRADLERTAAAGASRGRVSAAADAVDSSGAAVDAHVDLSEGPDAAVGGRDYANELAGTGATRGNPRRSPGASGASVAEVGRSGADAGARGTASARGASAANARGANGASAGTANGAGAGSAGVTNARGTAANGASAEADPAARPRSQVPSSAPGSAAAPGRLTIRAVVEREPDRREAAGSHSYLAWGLAAVAVLALGWGVTHLLGRHSSINATPSSTAPSPNTAQPTRPSDEAAGPRESTPAPSTPAQSASVPPKAEQRSRQQPTANPNQTSRGASTNGTTSTAVVHEEIPNVPRSALATIHGHVRVAVRVTVDPSGNVVNDSLDHAGPSRYFARVASQAARKWKFAPASDTSNRQWLVHFEFSRTGTTAHATGGGS
jgi:TonB family protein